MDNDLAARWLIPTCRVGGGWWFSKCKLQWTSHRGLVRARDRLRGRVVEGWIAWVLSAYQK